MDVIILPSEGQALELLSDAVDDVNVLKLQLKQIEASPAPSVLSLTASSGFSSSSPETLSDAEDDEEGVNANAGISVATTATTGSTQAQAKAFRDYANACDRVRNFYAEQHAKQTMAFNLRARANFRSRQKTRLSVWDAMERLNKWIDDSDPDTSLSQIEHLVQTAESIRRDGKPEWMQVVGLVHDLGKLLHLLGSEGQWDVVGDTFIVGAAFSDKNIYPETFAANPDSTHPIYSTLNGIYKPGCGLDNVLISWGHDEYMYTIAKEQSTLPLEGLAMIRYHSFYPWHREGAYTHFMTEQDQKYLAAVNEFNPYDLYSKADEPIDIEAIRPYYQGLIAKFFPQIVEW